MWMWLRPTSVCVRTPHIHAYIESKHRDKYIVSIEIIMLCWAVVATTAAAAAAHIHRAQPNRGTHCLPFWIEQTIESTRLKYTCTRRQIAMRSCALHNTNATHCNGFAIEWNRPLFFLSNHSTNGTDSSPFRKPLWRAAPHKLMHTNWCFGICEIRIGL